MGRRTLRLPSWLRRADRVVFDAAPPAAPKYAHGTRESYRNAKCRCSDCRAAHAAAQIADNAVRAARLLADPTLVEHGKWSTYVNWRCRCDECKAEASRVNKAAYRRKKAQS